ncbi:MAG TPA: hypothetical protein VGK93_03440 [Candidatus Eisenbacteria bacterium]
MFDSKLGRTVLAILALGLFVLEAFAFTNLGRTAQRLGAGDPTSVVVATQTAGRVLMGVVARGVGRVAAGVAVRLAARGRWLARGPARLASETMSRPSGPVWLAAVTVPVRGCSRRVVVIRTARDLHPARGWYPLNVDRRAHRRPMVPSPA